MDTITTASLSGVEEGDMVTMYLEEDRWYVKLFYFLTFREAPNKLHTYTVSSVSDCIISLEEAE